MRNLLTIILILAAGTSYAQQSTNTAPQPLNAGSWQVYFSPTGGSTAAVVKELDNAKSNILVQAFTFTSAPIARALVDAHKRSVQV